MEDKKRLLDNFLSLSALQIFTYVLPLITLPYLVNVLGVERYGLVMFAQSFVMFFYVLVDYGFNLSATREVAVNRENKSKITEIYSSVMIIKVVLLLVSFLILALLVLFVDKFYEEAPLYLLTFLMVVGQALFPVWYFQGMEKMRYITIVNVFSRIIFAISIFIFIKDKSDYLLVAFLNGMGICVGSFYAIWVIRRDFKQKLKLQRIETLLMYFSDSTRFFLSRVAVSLYTSANAFVLGLFTSNTMVGYYSIAEKLYRAIQGLYGPINQVLYPYVAKERNVSLYKKIFYFVISLNTLGVITAFFIAEPVFAVLFSKEVSAESISVFHIFLIANLVAVPSVLFGYPFLAALGHTNFTNNSVIFSSIYHIAGLLFITTFLEVTIYSVSILFVSTAVLECLIRVYGIKKYGLWKLA